MKFRNFGNTGLTVSEIGFGGSRIGGVFASRGSRNEALSVLGLALDAGITFYDTADMYSQGESESLIGTAFRGHRQQVILATKGGYSLPTRRNLIRLIKPLVRPVVQALGLRRARLPSGISGTLSQDFTPSYLTRALEGSLRRLRTDYVDLYQLHSPGAAFMQSGAFGEALQTLERMKAQGKIRFFGVATEVPQDAAYCLTAPGISSIQLGFGLLDLQALDEGTLQVAEARGLAVIARGCFAGGLLNDNVPENELKLLTPEWRRVVALRSFSAGFRRPLPEMALQFCRSTAAVSVTVLGMRIERHLTESVRYLQGPPLDAAQCAQLRNLAQTSG